MSRMAETINRLLVARKTKVVCSVYETNDYSIFKELEFNRDVSVFRVEKLIASLKENEILNPIVVNEKMEIIDGQGRFEALKVLGRPIKFVFSYGATIDDCRRMNAYNTKWSQRDFVYSFASAGNQNYINILNFHKETNMPFERALRFINRASTRDVKKDGKKIGKINVINSGELVFTKDDCASAIRISNMAKEIKTALDLSERATDTFYVAVKVMVDFPGYNHDKMLKKCKLRRNNFVQTAGVENMLKELSKIYNYNSSVKTRLYFEDYMRNRGYNAESYDKDFTVHSAKTLGKENNNE